MYSSDREGQPVTDSPDALPAGAPSDSRGFRADGCRVFAAMSQARPDNLESLGREVTEWLQANPDLRIVRTDTRLQHAEGFVWLVMVVFYTGHEADTPA